MGHFVLTHAETPKESHSNFWPSFSAKIRRCKTVPLEHWRQISRIAILAVLTASSPSGAMMQDKDWGEENPSKRSAAAVESDSPKREKDKAASTKHVLEIQLRTYSFFTKMSPFQQKQAIQLLSQEETPEGWEPVFALLDTIAKSQVTALHDSDFLNFLRCLAQIEGHEKRLSTLIHTQSIVEKHNVQSHIMMIIDALGRVPTLSMQGEIASQCIEHTFQTLQSRRFLNGDLNRDPVSNFIISTQDSLLVSQVLNGLPAEEGEKIRQLVKALPNSPNVLSITQFFRGIPSHPERESLAKLAAPYYHRLSSNSDCSILEAFASITPEPLRQSVAQEILSLFPDQDLRFNAPLMSQLIRLWSTLRDDETRRVADFFFIFRKRSMDLSPLTQYLLLSSLDPLSHAARKSVTSLALELPIAPDKPDFSVYFYTRALALLPDDETRSSVARIMPTLWKPDLRYYSVGRPKPWLEDPTSHTSPIEDTVQALAALTPHEKRAHVVTYILPLIDQTFRSNHSSLLPGDLPILLKLFGDSPSLEQQNLLFQDIQSIVQAQLAELGQGSFSGTLELLGSFTDANTRHETIRVTSTFCTNMRIKNPDDRGWVFDTFAGQKDLHAVKELALLCDTHLSRIPALSDQAKLNVLVGLSLFSTFEERKEVASSLHQLFEQYPFFKDCFDLDTHPFFDFMKALLTIQDRPLRLLMIDVAPLLFNKCQNPQPMEEFLAVLAALNDSEEIRGFCKGASLFMIPFDTEEYQWEEYIVFGLFSAREKGNILEMAQRIRKQIEDEMRGGATEAGFFQRRALELIKDPTAPLAGSA